MKNLLIVSSYPNNRCGVSDYTKDLINHVSPQKIKIDTFTIKFIDHPFKYFITVISLINKLLNSKYDVINFQYTPTILGPLAPLFIFMTKMNTSKIILTVHESYNVYLNHLPKPLHFVFKAYEGMLLKESNKVIVLSNIQKSNIINNFKLDSEKIYMIPLGIDTSVKINIINNKYNSITKKHLIGFFGFIRPGKGLEILLEAFSDLEKPKREAYTLLIAGKAMNETYLKELKNYINKKKIRNVEWLGFLEEKDMLYLMSKCDCVVLPYSKSTNSAILMKAIQSLTPVIASNTGSLKEYVDHLKIGLTFKNNDVKSLNLKLSEFVSDRNKVHLFKDNLKKALKVMDYKNIGRKYGELINYA